MLTSCLECNGSQFTFQYRINGTLTADDASVQAPAAVEMFASERFEPICGQPVVVTKVAFYAGSQLLAVDTSAPYEYTWDVIAGKDGVPTTGRAKIALYAISNDIYKSATPNLEVISTALNTSP
jgi:hypothetical protein